DLFGQDRKAKFDFVHAGDVVAKKKPAPDIYLLALETLALPPQDCVVIEDSRNGLLAATGAGLPTLITTSTYTVDEDFTGAVKVVPELGDEPNVNVRLADLGELAAANAAAGRIEWRFPRSRSSARSGPPARPCCATSTTFRTSTVSPATVTSAPRSPPASA